MVEPKKSLNNNYFLSALRALYDVPRSDFSRTPDQSGQPLLANIHVGSFACLIKPVRKIVLHRDISNHLGEEFVRELPAILGALKFPAILTLNL